LTNKPIAFLHLHRNDSFWFFFNKVVSMEVSALYSLNIYVFDLGIQIKLSTQGAM